MKAYHYKGMKLCLDDFIPHTGLRLSKIKVTNAHLSILMTKS